MIVVPAAVGPPISEGKPEPGSESAPVLVKGYEERIGIVPVYVLGAVPMMAVRIHYGHAVYSVSLAKVLDHDGFDVDIAEASSPVDTRMA